MLYELPMFQRVGRRATKDWVTPWPWLGWGIQTGRSDAWPAPMARGTTSIGGGAAGRWLQVGLYASPHLREFTERIG
jgi:hypothetical protein